VEELDDAGLHVEAPRTGGGAGIGVYGERPVGDRAHRPHRVEVTDQDDAGAGPVGGATAAGSAEAPAQVTATAHGEALGTGPQQLRAERGDDLGAARARVEVG
jgi:hypothetical protein